MSETRIIIEPYRESMLEEFVEVVRQGSLLRLDPDDPSHMESMRSCLTQENSILMAIRDARTRDFLGYCDVHNTDRHPWEVGIKLLERNWGKGIGYKALALFLPSLANECGAEGLIARIAPDNLASIRLFQKLGATPREVVLSEYMLDDEMAAEFAERHLELLDETVVEMASLFGVEPERLLGRTLVFDVPVKPPVSKPENPADRKAARKRESRASALRASEERFYANELSKVLLAIKDLAVDEGGEAEFSRAFAELRERWGL